MTAPVYRQDSDHAACIVASASSSQLNYSTVRAYWALRIGYPWNTRVIAKLVAMMGGEFPFLTNHFFVLRARCPDENSLGTT
jgi:hypothetical protein